MLSVQEAQNRVLDSVARLNPVTKPIDLALDHFTSETIVSPADVPPFDNSAMDGFAVRSAETESASKVKPVRLIIGGTVRAGDTPSLVLEEGKCIRIMTGATIPEGADSVIKIEDVNVDDGSVLVTDPATRGENIRMTGEDIKQSETLLDPGTQLRPQELGVLASLGIAQVKVTRKPTVSILTTGDELVAVDETLAPGKIRDSNRYSLSAIVRRLGCESVAQGIVPDQPEIMEAAFRKALARSDALLSTGGVSMGQFDFVREIIQRMGKIEFWKVNMKPGKPLLFATAEGKPVFGLPGNPVSCMVSFELFTRPALLKMMGSKVLHKEVLRARLASPINKRTGRAEYKRGRMWRDGGELLVDLTGPQGSGILTSLVKGNCLICLPEDRGDAAIGEEVDVIPI